MTLPRARPSTLLLAAVIALAAVYCSVYFTYRINDLPGALPRHEQDQCLRYLRAALDGHGSSVDPPSVQSRSRGPAWATIYILGKPVFRHRSDNADFRELERAIRADERLKRLSVARLRLARIKVDLAVATGPIFTKIPLFFAKSVVPGLDGIGLTVAGKHAYLLPDDLFRRQLLADFQPFFFMHEFRTGVNLKEVIDLLADELDLSSEDWRSKPKRFFRFRVQSFVEGTHEDRRRALPVKRSRVPIYEINRAQVREAVVRSADYVLRQIGYKGRFKYIYYPLDGRHSPPGSYSLPRHAGTTWFLSLAYRALKSKRYHEGARRAIEYLAAHAVPEQCKSTPYACVGSAGRADLGSASLSVVAIAEYQVATGDRSYLPLARRLGRFLIWMQKPNGDFCHQYNPLRREKNCRDILLYYSGEASLALAKLYLITGDRIYLDPLQRALDFLTDDKYDFFMGKFFISEDHWTCIAAEAAGRINVEGFVARDSYARFCYEFAALNRRAQVEPGEGLLEDLYGSFVITPFFLPHNTPVGSRTEANVATYLLSQRRGEPQPEILQTIHRSIRYLVDQQIRPESAYLYLSPQAATGGMMQTPGRASIRIDYVQHAAAAMARALPLIPE